jgi:exonuclease VII small subunit
MKNSIIYIIFSIFITFLTLKACDSRNSKRFESKIQDLEKLNDSLNAVNDNINDSINHYKTLTYKQKIEVDSLKEVKQKIKIERYEIPVIVDSYPTTKLDSILTSYKHPN